jgi:serpin B
MAAPEHEEAVDVATVDALLSRTTSRSVELRHRRVLFGGGGSALAIALILSLAVVLRPSGRPLVVGPLAEKGVVVAARLDGAAEYSLPAARAIPRLGSPQEHGVSSAEQDFSIRLLRQLLLNRAGKQSLANEVACPASLAVALSMVELGAKGETESQIASVLGTAKLSPAEQAAGWEALDADLAQGASSATLELQQASALWSQQGLPLVPAFLRELRMYYGAGVWEADLNSAAATTAINTWASEETHGKITELFPPGPVGASAILADAVYFKGAWAHAFDSTTVTSSFNTASGTIVQAQYMLTKGKVDLSWSNGPSFEAIELPYKGGRFSALVVMPKTTSLQALIAGLDPAKMSRIFESLHSSPVVLRMPSFEFSTSLNLSYALQSMGMTDAFGPAANLTGLSASGSSRVGSVVQKVFLRVTTAGTVAAAATAGTIASSANLPNSTLNINHSFLFLIRDNETGTLLFASSVVNPTA